MAAPSTPAAPDTDTALGMAAGAENSPSAPWELIAAATQTKVDADEETRKRVLREWHAELQHDREAVGKRKKFRNFLRETPRPCGAPRQPPTPHPPNVNVGSREATDDFLFLGKNSATASTRFSRNIEIWGCGRGAARAGVS